MWPSQQTISSEIFHKEQKYCYQLHQIAIINKLGYLPRPTSAALCVHPLTPHQSRSAIKLHQNLPN
jgi:hypothetical protein